MRRRDRTTDSGRSRAQTTIDYAVGVGIFLLAIAWVIGTVPQIVQPFDDAQDQPLVANRAADRLASDALSPPDEQTALATECVDGFFHNDTPPGDCEYDKEPIGDAIGVGGDYDVNVTLLHDGTVATLSDGSDATRGDPVPASGQVVAARRSVLVGGELHQLLVRVW
ncbi:MULTISPECIES: hypothetical protein [Haloferax]|uniref:Uncharacterized protein n=1 Tax=Haloferax marinum TaxID=2666143 RepID=A0A6A8G3U3_9EURY|nr:MULTISPECIES: hypothetical protein [Haloferax]KAB1196615.1 hypothetical protein Hfx1150_03405 [Haloferax sp. CBA1150]MRW95619.1 hypothetical protein [Haloferax marinum]